MTDPTYSVIECSSEGRLVPSVGSGTVNDLRAHAQLGRRLQRRRYNEQSVQQNGSPRQNRVVFVLFGLFSTCDALVTIGEAAEAREHMLTFERVAQAATLLLAAQDGEADTDAFRKNRDISLAAGLYEDRRSTVTLVDKPSRRPPTKMGPSTTMGEQLHNEAPQ